MAVTQRFVLLLLGGSVVILFAAFFYVSWLIFVLYNLLCLALLFVDYYISPNQSELEIVREGNENLSIYEKEPISFMVHNKSILPLKVELSDEFPDFHFDIATQVISSLVLPNERKKLEYLVVPTKRGNYNFKKLSVRFEGKLGLCKKAYKVDLSRQYKVYPNLKNLRKYRLSICNNRFLKQGQKNLKLLGKGTAFESLREYVRGDEYRKINWKATSRYSKPIVNQYEPEKNQHVYMMIDTGRVMNQTVRGFRKLDLVVNTSLILSDMINQNGDESGLLLFNTSVTDFIMPGKGLGHRSKIMDTLYDIDYSSEASNYEEALFQIKKKERHRSIIFLFTDFETEDEAKDLLKWLPIIRRNHLVMVILVKNEKIENMADLPVKNEENMFAKGVALDMLLERQHLINMLNKRGIFCKEFEAEKLETNVINRYIHVKNKTYM